MQQIRKTIFIILIGTVCLTATPTKTEAAIPIWQIIKEAVVKVIKAVDLMIQRLQNKTIWLQEAQKVLENKLHDLKLTEIAEWTEKHRKLYEQYYNELWEVKNAIATYNRIRQLMELQIKIVDEYKRAWNLLQQDENFTQREIDYMYMVYSGILEESVKNLDEILLVVNSFKTQMTDANRLEIISTAGENLERNYADLKRFNAQNVLLSLNRAKDVHEIETVRKLYGL